MLVTYNGLNGHLVTGLSVFVTSILHSLDLKNKFNWAGQKEWNQIDLGFTLPT